jgi:hypothetical protein
MYTLLNYLVIKKGEGRQEEIFPNDLRIQEVLRWLNFAFPVTIKMPSGTQTMRLIISFYMQHT